jgi:hypothetical protein
MECGSLLPPWSHYKGGRKLRFPVGLTENERLAHALTVIGLRPPAALWRGVFALCFSGATLTSVCTHYQLTDCTTWWDNPTMTIRADSKKRIVLPAASPGDVYDVQDHGDGRFTLVRLVRPEPKARLTRAQCLKAIAAAPLHPTMDWTALRRLTREP